LYFYYHNLPSSPSLPFIKFLPSRTQLTRPRHRLPHHPYPNCLLTFFSSHPNSLDHAQQYHQLNRYLTLPTTMSSDTSETPKYDCDVCGNEFPDSAGVLAYVEHFYCNDCAIEVFHRSMTDINEFPAPCCSRPRNRLPPSLFENLLGKKVYGQLPLETELALHSRDHPRLLCECTMRPLPPPSQLQQQRPAPHYCRLRLRHDYLRWLQVRAEGRSYLCATHLHQPPSLGA
jgi:hypothetical protein